MLLSLFINQDNFLKSLLFVVHLDEESKLDQAAALPPSEDLSSQGATADPTSATVNGIPVDEDLFMEDVEVDEDLFDQDLDLEDELDDLELNG